MLKLNRMLDSLAGSRRWRNVACPDENQRACMEPHIEELKNDLQADGFCMRDFFAKESAFLAVCITHNLLSI